MKILLLALVLSFAAAAHGQISGRYTDGRDYVVYFKQTKYGPSIRPVLWTATQLLKGIGKDKFVVVDRPSRGAEFQRDPKGRVTGVVIRGMDGEGLHLVRSDGPLLPVELLLSGKTREAVRRYAQRGPEGLSTAVEIARRVLERQPTKTRLVVGFLKALSPHFASDAPFNSLLGFAYVQAGDRHRAAESFRLAHRLDPTNEDAISGLFRLGLMPDAPKKNGGWPVPFNVSEVFRQPTIEEIRAVEADWASRDLSVKGVRQELRKTISFDGWQADVRVVSHLVHGSRHYGAIIMPLDASPGCCAVIVDAKGVSPSYFPLTIENVDSVRMMGDSRGRFVYVVPSFRGEVMKVGDRTFTSEGDRRDALDGATDDAIALLNVALATTPQADAERVCVYGHSRGGNVALLVGERDRRIKCVVDVAGPTDWFYLMGTDGWTEEELWREAIRTRANTFETGGQNVERFLMRAIEGKASLADVRHNMIASSPLYFADRLRARTQLHYGLEDPSVPSRNGRAFVAKLRRKAQTAKILQAFFYPGEGHDTDRLAMPEAARKFILKSLDLKFQLR